MQLSKGADACNYQKGWRVKRDIIRGHPQISRQIPMAEDEMLDHITGQETSAGNDAVVDTLITRNYTRSGASGRDYSKEALIAGPAINPVQVFRA